MSISVSVFRGLVAALVLAGAGLLTGCSFNTTGRSSDVSPFKINAPSDLLGLSRPAVVETLGLPSGRLRDERGVEYWQYLNASQYHILIFGHGERKNLLLRFDEDKVDSVKLVERGSSTNVFRLPK